MHWNVWPLLFGGLIALPSVSLTASAQASGVTIDGQLVGAVTYQRSNGGAQAPWQVGASPIAQSLMGFRGSEDLGSGLRAGFALETGLELDRGVSGGAGGKFWNRQSYVELAQGTTSVTFGRQYPAHIARYVESYDVYGAGGSGHVTPVALVGTNRYRGFDSRTDNSVRIVGRGKQVQWGLSGGLSEGAGSSSSAEVTLIQGRLRTGLYAARYDAGDAQVVAGTRPEQSIYGLGAHWAGGHYDVTGSWLVSRHDVASGRQRHEMATLGVAYRNLPRWQYRAMVAVDSASDLHGVVGRSGHKTTLVASVDYFLSRRSRLMASWSENRLTGAYASDPINVAVLGLNPTQGKVSTWSVGVRHNF